MASKDCGWLCLCAHFNSFACALTSNHFLALLEQSLDQRDACQALSTCRIFEARCVYVWKAGVRVGCGRLGQVCIHLILLCSTLTHTRWPRPGSTLSPHAPYTMTGAPAAAMRCVPGREIVLVADEVMMDVLCFCWAAALLRCTRLAPSCCCATALTRCCLRRAGRMRGDGATGLHGEDA